MNIELQHPKTIIMDTPVGYFDRPKISELGLIRIKARIPSPEFREGELVAYDKNGKITGIRSHC